MFCASTLWMSPGLTNEESVTLGVSGTWFAIIYHPYLKAESGLWSSPDVCPVDALIHRSVPPGPSALLAQEHCLNVEVLLLTLMIC